MNNNDKLRTLRQNKSLHLFFAQLSEALNDAGFDIKKTLSQKIEHPWTPTLVKELLWRPVQKSYLRKKSTKKLATDDIDKIYDIINRYLSTTLFLEVPEFPSLETLIEKNNDTKSRNNFKTN